MRRHYRQFRFNTKAALWCKCSITTITGVIIITTLGVIITTIITATITIGAIITSKKAACYGRPFYLTSPASIPDWLQG